MKEFRQPDRSMDDSFDLDEVEELEAPSQTRSRKPGKVAMTESLEQVLDLIGDSRLPAAHRERIAARYLLERDSAGQILEGTLARDYGQRLGMDLGGVRVHTDSETAAIASALGATALTFGKEIFFASGVYQPSSPRGKQVIAHEIAHVAQHRGRAPTAGSRLEVGREGDRHEREADAVASKLLRGRRAKVSRASAGVRFMRQAFGELDEPIVAEGAGGLGCSPEELEEIQRLVDSGKAVELLDGATSQREKNIIRFCIGRSDIAQDEATKAFMREHDNPTPDQHFEIQGVNQAQRAAEEAADSSKQEPSDLGQQPDEVPRVQTASARSAEAGAPGGSEAERQGIEDAQGISALGGADESAIRKALADHEVMLVMQGLDEGLAAYVTDPANFEDFGLADAAELLKKVGTFSGIGQAMVGAQSLYALINRDWEQTWEQLSSYGEGATEYERLANNIKLIVDSVDLMLDTVRGVADALGSANSGLWLSNVMSTVDTGEIASALSSIAQGVTTAAGVLAMIRNSVLAPAETTFRELDRYQKQADPGAPEQAAAVLLEGADGLLALLGGMATTPGGGGPENASGSQRAGDAEQSEVATPSPADLPLQDVSPQGYESMAGESADVEEDAAGIAVRDQNRDPERAAPGGRQLAETEAADDMTGRGKPDATPDRAQVESESSEAESQMQSASAVGGTESDEYSGGGDGQPTSHASSSASEVPLEIDAGGQERVAASSRPVEAETDNSARARLEYYQNAGNPEPGQLPSSPASAPGGDHPPTTLAFLDRLKRTIAFLHETRNQATTTKSADLGPQSKSLQERGLELHKDIAARQDAHRTQEQRLGAAEISARQFKAESTRGNTALETLNRIADVSQMVGQLPGRLGATIAGLSQRIGRATKTWSFVSQQMGGQEQEVAALKARQVTEARRLEAVAERSNKASDKLAQADAALKSAGGAEAGSESAETGAIDRQLDRYKSTYNRLSAELAAWAQRNQS